MRLKYVCRDSLQNRDRKSNTKKEKSQDNDACEVETRKRPILLPTYDCEGAIHVKFSLKRQAINVVYKHNPIHTTRHDGDRYVDCNSNTRLYLHYLACHPWYQT